jgi:hypothetical protein
LTTVHWLQLSGLAANVVGTFMIATEVISASRARDLLAHLFRSLFPGSGHRYANVLADISSLSEKGKGSVVRGTALLLIGFVFQLASVLVDGLGR